MHGRLLHCFDLHASVPLEQIFDKPYEEPLLAAHEQAKLNDMAKEDAKIEAKRLAEEEQQNFERQHCEVTLFAPIMNIQISLRFLFNQSA